MQEATRPGQLNLQTKMVGTSYQQRSAFSTGFRCGVVALLSGGLLAYAWISRGWPLMHDMQVMHYVAFLIGKGWSPYRQIGDMNMPGAYLTEVAALKLYGSADLGWRLYDFTLGALLIWASAIVTRKTDWKAGFAGAACFTIFHGYEGPQFAGERDQAIAVLLVVGAACLLEAFREDKPWLMLFFGLAQSFAVAIKPTVILLPIVLLVMAGLHAKEKRRSIAPLLLFTAVGFAISTLLVFGFLVIHGSLGAFLFVLTKVLPHYATFGSPGWGFLLKSTVPKQILDLLLGAVAVALILRRPIPWEQGVVLAGVLIGIANFYLQGKGFDQHRYLALAFLLIWIFDLLFAGLQGVLVSKVIAIATICLALFTFMAHDLRFMRTWPDKFLPTEALEHDLARLGTQNLQGQVQCLDIVGGCLAALFHERIVQQTGATGDLLYFLPVDAPVVAAARDAYWRVLQNEPPVALILFNTRFEGGGSFRKVQNWPQFELLLQTRYKELVQRDFPNNATVVSPSSADPAYTAYRIYVRKDSPLANAKLNDGRSE